MKKLGKEVLAGILVAGLFTPGIVKAKEEKVLTTEGTITTVFQQMIKSKGDFNSTSGLSSAGEFAFSFTPTEKDEIFLNLSVASGNAVNDRSPFNLSPYADDLEDDLSQINGRKHRNNVLEFWYSHEFSLMKDAKLKITAGIIDATGYIDDNEYANDETAQFMQDPFVNNPIANLPSYDYGGVVEFEKGNVTAKFLYMHPKDGDNEIYYDYFTLQLGYKADLSFGEGNYRIYAFTTSKDFPKTNSEKASLKGAGVSFDQEVIKDTLGIFFRAGWQDDEAVDYKNCFSFGINAPLKKYFKYGDTFGAGISYLQGVKDIDHTASFETYVKFDLGSYKKQISSDLTLDFQYMQDKSSDGETSGYFLGARWNVSF
jgi:porin